MEKPAKAWLPPSLPRLPENEAQCRLCLSGQCCDAWRAQAVEAVEAAVLELAGTAPAPPEPEGSRLLRMAGGALRRAGGSIARQVRCRPGV